MAQDVSITPTLGRKVLCKLVPALSYFGALGFERVGDYEVGQLVIAAVPPKSRYYPIT